MSLLPAGESSLQEQAPCGHAPALPTTHTDNTRAPTTACQPAQAPAAAAASLMLAPTPSAPTPAVQVGVPDASTDDVSADQCL